MPKRVTVAIFLAPVENVAGSRNGIDGAAKKFFVVQEAAVLVCHNHIGYVQVFRFEPAARILGALVVAAVVIRMKMILAGVPTALVPIGPALHDDGDVSSPIGGDIHGSLGIAVLRTFESGEPQTPDWNLKSVITAGYKKAFAFGSGT